jgi:hypothetical protein
MVTAAAGATGATGASGTMWHSGTVAPGSGLGADGAFYLNTATADIYKKISGAWVFQVNIKGAGVPTGGDVGNALVKTGAGDYATGWATPTALVTGIGVGGVLSGSLPNPGFAVDMATQSELDAVAAAKQSLSEKGEPDGYAELDGTGKVPTSQLPAFVDDVIEAANFAALPGTGESGKIYVTLDDNKTFRWSGSAYTEISASLALGETSATAYRGDRGKTAYDHSQETNANPHATKFNQLSDAPHAYTGHGEKLVAVKADETGVEFVDAPAGGGGAGGHVIQDDGTPQTARANLNFFGAGVLVSDNAADDSTDIEIPAGLGSGVAAKISVKITANQNAVNNTPKNIAFDVQEYSTGDGFSWSSGDPTKITATESFDCLAVGTVEFDANGSGVRMVDITKNGSTMVSQRQQAASTDQTNVTLSDIFSVAAGDYVQLSVKQNSGGALDIRDVSRLRLVRIAPVQTPGTVEFASQAEAEAGTDETKSMNPLRTAQAIAALGGGGDGNAETIQGRAVADTAPEDGQAIVWDNAGSTWKPGTVSGGGGGSGATIEDEFLYGETIAANQPVYIELNGAAGTAGRIYKMDGGDSRKSTTAWFLGFAIDAGNAGDTGTVRMAGKITGLSSLTVGAVQYAASGGGVTETAPSFSRIVAIAENATTLVINSRGANDVVLATQTVIAGVKGYTLGGQTGPTVAADKLVFSTETTSLQSSANLTVARRSNAGLSNAVDKGYSIAGYGSGGAVATADRVAFGTDTTVAVPSANATSSVYDVSGVSERVTKGYVCGSGFGNKLVFSTETTSLQSSANANNSQCSGMNGGASKGYMNGGGFGDTTGRKITFSTDTLSNTALANFSVGRGIVGTMSDGTVKGFWIGGTDAGTTSEKTTFSTDTTSLAASADLSSGEYGIFGISEGATKGFGLGGNGGVASDKVTYSTEVRSAQSSANVSSTRYQGASAGDVGL